MRIIDLTPEEERAVRQMAALLFETFREHYPDSWPSMESALNEVRESFAPGRLSRAALDDVDDVVGWVGAISQYDDHVWELHPLVVRPDKQRQGIGRALVRDLEAQVRSRGGLTLWVGTDDADAQTSLSGVDLYPDPLAHLARIKNLRGHPYEFYQRCGFALIGVMPDANGFGKPDIYMAKRVGR